MKSIAEYFRDLAADDRYFGAEPPTPDAEMLHRIAEREVQKRVEARIEGDGIVLRQTESDRPAEAPAAAALIAAEKAPAVEPEDIEDVTEAEPDTYEDEAQAEAEAEAEPAPEPRRYPHEVMTEPEADEAADDEVMDIADTPHPADVAAESIAAKLQRIRAVVDQRQQDEAADELEDELAEDFYADTETLDAAFEPAAAVDMPDSFDDDDYDEDDEETVIEAEAEPEAEVEEPAVDYAVEARRYAEDLAAEDEDDFDDDEFDEFEDELEADDEDGDEVEDQDDDFADVATLADVADKVAAEPAADLSEDDGEDDETDDDTALAAVLRAVPHEPDDVEEDDFEEEEALADEWDAALDDDDFDDEDEDDEDDNVFAEDEADIEPTPLRRVAQAPAEPEDMGEGDSMLSPEEEAELMAELAEVERETDEAKPQKSGRKKFADPDLAGKDVAVERILAETNTKLDSTEVKSRRSAIAHLRAAVQATRAFKDQKSGMDPEIDAEKEEYRDDLARVVRPRRPGSLDKSARRLAPLVLVSEQRVDADDDDEDDSPVSATARPAIRPRRVTKGNLALSPTDDPEQAQFDDEDDDEDVGARVAEHAADDVQELPSDFATFADQVGATGTDERLEAAAAYEIFVVGRPHFSRPQIMKHVMLADPDGSFSREEGLRAFGKLLREGVITKIKRGQFEITEQTRFRPDDL